MVLHRDANAFVLNKPPGLATQGGTKTHQHLDRLLDGLADDDGNRPKLVHRLDKDTSGALLVARSARAAGHFAKAFAGRTARKVYWALIVDVPSLDEGLIDLPLAKQPGTGGEKMHVSPEAGLPSKTRRRLIDRRGKRAAAGARGGRAARPPGGRLAVEAPLAADRPRRKPRCVGGAAAANGSDASA